jgi:hypothetical protein
MPGSLIAGDPQLCPFGRPVPGIDYQFFAQRFTILDKDEATDGPGKVPSEPPEPWGAWAVPDVLLLGAETV